MKRIASIALALSLISTSAQSYEEEIICTYDCAGEGYYNSRRACQLVVGTLVGAAVIATMIVIVVKDGKSAHSAH